MCTWHRSESPLWRRACSGNGSAAGRLTALAVATAGFCLVAAPTVRAAGIAGLTLALVAAGLFVALILLSKPLASIYGGLRLAFIELAGAGVVLVPVALAMAWPAPAWSWLWLVVLGVVHTAIGITLYLSVLARIPATHVGILGYLEPVRGGDRSVAGARAATHAGDRCRRCAGRGRRRHRRRFRL